MGPVNTRSRISTRASLDQSDQDSSNQSFYTQDSIIIPQIEYSQLIKIIQEATKPIVDELKLIRQLNEETNRRLQRIENIMIQLVPAQKSIKVEDSKMYKMQQKHNHNSRVKKENGKCSSLNTYLERFLLLLDDQQKNLGRSIKNVIRQSKGQVSMNQRFDFIGFFLWIKMVEKTESKYDDLVLHLVSRTFSNRQQHCQIISRYGETKVEQRIRKIVQGAWKVYNQDINFFNFQEFIKTIQMQEAGREIYLRQTQQQSLQRVMLLVLINLDECKKIQRLTYVMFWVKVKYFRSHPDLEERFKQVDPEVRRLVQRILYQARTELLLI